MADQDKYEAYWKENLTYVVILLSIWFVVSYVCGIIFADALDNIRLAGFPLGFWFANQVLFHQYLDMYFQIRGLK